MNRFYFTFLVSMFVFFLCSCEKAELPVKAHDPGNVITTSVNMESNYKWQVYYNLKTNTIVGKNLKTSWDLGFEANQEGFHVILNSAKVMLAYQTTRNHFEDVKDTSGFYENRKWDAPCGSVDSTAIGDWREKSSIYIIDRGYSEIGVHQGFRKIQILSVDDHKYSLRIANLNGSNDQRLEIEKNPRYNFMFLSFQTNHLVDVEPPKDEWDLVFTQYTHVFYNPEMTYLVTGCLLNRYKMVATADKISDFTAITYSTILNYQFVSDINVIGYDWKTYTGNTYIINSKTNYIIRNSEGCYYKLHFIDFFNTNGVKGNPKWEFQAL